MNREEKLELINEENIKYNEKNLIILERRKGETDFSLTSWVLNKVDYEDASYIK